MRDRLLTWFRGRADDRAKADNRRLYHENHALAQELVAAAKRVNEVKAAYGLLVVKHAGLQMRFDNARAEARELRAVLRQADSYIAELETQASVLKARRPQAVSA